jgi:hypothetical protein
VWFIYAAKSETLIVRTTNRQDGSDAQSTSSVDRAHTSARFSEISSSPSRGDEDYQQRPKEYTIIDL